MKKNKGKEIAISGLELNLPPKHHPEWLRLGIEPYEIDTSRISKEEFQQMKQRHMSQKNIQKPVSQPKEIPGARGMPPLAIKDERIPSRIRDAEHMADPKESMWYDEFPDDANEENIIDNNETVDIESIQRVVVPERVEKLVEQVAKVKLSEGQTINQIRKSLMEEKVEKKPDVPIIQPGEFMVVFRGETIAVGDKDETVTACTNVIMSQGDFGDDDLVVLVRVPIAHLYK